LEWEIWQDGAVPCLTLNFKLRKGVYATSLAREVMKTEVMKTEGVSDLAPPDPRPS